MVINTARERSASYARHALGNGNARQRWAAKERIVSYARHTVWNVDADEGWAAIERIESYARHAVWNVDAGEGWAAIERIASYARHALGNGNARQRWAAIERKVSYARHALGDNGIFTTQNQLIAWCLYNSIASVTWIKRFITFGDIDWFNLFTISVSIISWLSVLYALNGRKVTVWILYRYEMAKI